MKSDFAYEYMEEITLEDNDSPIKENHTDEPSSYWAWTWMWTRYLPSPRDFVDHIFHSSDYESEALLPEDLEKKNYSTFNDANETTDDDTEIPETYWAWAWKWTSYLPSPRTLLEQIKNYLPTPKTIAYLLAATFSALPNIPYALGFPSGTQPRDFTLDWWFNLPLESQIMALSYAGITVTVGTLVRLQYLPTLVADIREICSKWCSGPRNFLKNNLNLFLSIAAGISAAGLGYDSFIWAGMTYAIFSAIANGSVIGGFRIVFNTSFFNKFLNLFNQDHAFKQLFINGFKQLKSERVEELNEFLEGKELNDSVIKKIVKKLIRMMGKAHESNNHFHSTFNIPSPFDRIIKYLKNTLDIGIGLYLGTTFFLFFAQNGYRGLEILCQLLITGCYMDALSQASKIAIATLAGFSSGILAFMTGTEFSNIISSIYRRIIEHPKEALMLLLITFCAGIAATAIISPAKYITESSNLFGIKDNSIGYTFIFGNGGLSVLFDVIGLWKIFLKARNNQSSSPQVKDVIHRLETDKHSTEITKGLQNYGLFKTLSNKKEALEIPKNIKHQNRIRYQPA